MQISINYMSGKILYYFGLFLQRVFWSDLFHIGRFVNIYPLWNWCILKSYDLTEPGWRERLDLKKDR